MRFSILLFALYSILKVAGKISTKTGDQKDFDVALVWQDAATGFSVMTSKSADASFNAAADGKFKVLGMSIYAQWFEDGLKLVI